MLSLLAFGFLISGQGVCTCPDRGPEAFVRIFKFSYLCCICNFVSLKRAAFCYYRPLKNGETAKSSSKKLFSGFSTRVISIKSHEPFLPVHFTNSIFFEIDGLWFAYCHGRNKFYCPIHFSILFLRR